MSCSSYETSREMPPLGTDEPWEEPSSSLSASKPAVAAYSQTQYSN